MDQTLVNTQGEKIKIVAKKYQQQKKKIVPKKEEIKVIKNKPKKIEVIEEELDLIEVLERQKPHLEKIASVFQGSEHFSSFPFFIDTSKPGSGKTATACFTAKNHGLSMVVICPVGLKETWKREAKKVDVEIIAMISYQSLASNFGCNPKHGLLKRVDTYDAKNKTKTVFHTTEAFEELLNTNVLLVFDEFSMIKTEDTGQAKSAGALCRRINHRHNTEFDFKSRIMFLSGTPVSELKQIVGLLRTLGLLGMQKKFIFKKGTVELGGIKPLVRLCNKINSKLTDSIVSTIHLDKSNQNVEKIIISLYVEILNPIISGGMIPPILKNIKMDIKNKFYTLEKKNFDQLEHDMNDLIDFVGYDSPNDKMKKSFKYNTIKQKRRRCNIQKIPILVRLVHHVFSKKKNVKIIIACEYVTGILDELCIQLSQYKPKLVCGSIDLDERLKIYQLFNQNDDQCKLLLTSKTSYFGVEFDDKFGDYQRYTYILPDFSMEYIYQFSHRTNREGTKSDSKVRIVFVKGLEVEFNVLRSLSRQSFATKLLLDPNVVQNSVFPDDYQYKVEGDSKVYASLEECVSSYASTN